MFIGVTIIQGRPQPTAWYVTAEKAEEAVRGGADVYIVHVRTDSPGTRHATVVLSIPPPVPERPMERPKARLS